MGCGLLDVVGMAAYMCKCIAVTHFICDLLLFSTMALTGLCVVVSYGVGKLRPEYKLSPCCCSTALLLKIDFTFGKGFLEKEKRERTNVLQLPNMAFKAKNVYYLALHRKCGSCVILKGLCTEDVVAVVPVTVVNQKLEDECYKYEFPSSFYQFSLCSESLLFCEA